MPVHILPEGQLVLVEREAVRWRRFNQVYEAPLLAWL